MSLRFRPEAAAALRAAILDARGAGGLAEVFAIGEVREKHVVSVTITCRGQEGAVIALVDQPQPGQVVVHNHPSGDLRPSDADMHLAGLYGDKGVGFVIVDDAVGRDNWVVEPFVRQEKPVDPDEVRRFFEVRLKAILPDFEPRPGQIDMALGVAEALSTKSAYVVEAGTGTGKSLAYLVPAALWALANESKVVVSTHTKALQGQLLASDIPLVQRAGLAARAAVLQGRANYVCKRRLGIADAEELDDRAELDALLDWEATSATGSRSDLPFSLSEGLWERVESDSDLTLRVRCPHYEQCRFYTARRTAAAAHLVVVNHALLFADRAIVAEGAEAGIIPKYGRVILDEAHHLEDAATGAISERATGRAIERAIAGLLSYRKKKGALYRTLEIANRRLPAGNPAEEKATVAAALAREVKDNARIALSDLAYTLGAADAPVRLDDRTKVPAFDEAIPRAAWLVGSMEATAAALGAVSALFDDVPLADTEMQPLLDIRRAQRRLAGHAQVVRGVFESEEATHCRWIEPVPSRNQSLDAAVVRAPIEVAPMLRRLLWDPIAGNVCTSATLTAAGKFDFWAQRAGRDAGERRDVLPSPFDHETQAILALPRDLPEPGDTEFDARTGEILLDAVRLSGGGAFVLCTSYQAVKSYGALLRGALPASMPVLTQGAGGRGVLLDRFRENPSSILVGTDSFWEGVSVKGEGLRLVVIPRLPFRVPTEPLRVARIEALQARGLDPFATYSLPETAIKLRQGYGRLIRHRGDRGVVLLLDRRVHSRWYGRVLLRSLPPARRVTGPWDVVREEIRTFYADAFPTRLEVR